MDTQTAARIQYLETGYDPIPLKPMTKDPARAGWPTRPTISQWRNTPANSNIGLRAGNGKAFIDCDDKNQPGTTENVTRWLDGLGLQEGDYPKVQTPSGGAHIYINFTAPMIDSKKNLLPSMGAGEFRYGQGAYVGAWPSVIETGKYVMVSGDLARAPELDMQDIAALINVNETQPQRPTRKMSRLAVAIAHGTKLDRHKSSSEGEEALVLSLINSGYSYEEIKHVFDTFPCLGHYSKKHAERSRREGERWLYMTYQNALAFSQHESPARRTIADLLARAQASTWSNANRKKVFIAHLEIAHRAGRLDYVASSRDLALTARVYRDTAMSQTARLIDAELLAIKTRGSVVSATVYSLEGTDLGKLPPLPKNTECEGVVEHSPAKKWGKDRLSDHDAFRNGGGKYARGRLGRRAGEIYELIFNNPLTIGEIVQRTGADKKTVKRALEKMYRFIDFRTGEILEMVSRNGDDTWQANLVDLDLIAGLTRTLGATGKQRIDYEKERRSHRRSLELGTLKVNP